MLQWICPECGRECEPEERDCPVCYPSAAAPAPKATVAPAAPPRPKPAAPPAPPPPPAAAAVAPPKPPAMPPPLPAPPPLPVATAVAPPPPPAPSFVPPAGLPSAFAPAAVTPQVLEMAAVAVEEPPVEAPVLDTLKVPIPTAMAAPAPDPVPAGLTALSANMRAFDNPVPPQVMRELDPPIPFEPGALSLGPEREFMPRDEAFFLDEADIAGLAMPRFLPASIEDVVRGEIAVWPGDPADDLPGPVLPPTVRELDFDPALLALAESDEEASRELKAMEAVGLAPLQDHLLYPGSCADVERPPVAPLQAELASEPWPATGVAVSQREDVAALADEELLEKVQDYYESLNAARSLERAAGKPVGLLVDPNAVAKIAAREPQPFAGAPVSFRGTPSPWPQAAPFGRPVGRFEIEFDDLVLKRVHEWEERGDEEVVEEPVLAEVVPEPEPEPEPDVPVAMVSEPEPEAVVPPEPEPELELEPEVPAPQTMAMTPLHMSLATTGQQEEEAGPKVEVLTPIVESPVPPTARMMPLTFQAFEPVGREPRPRQCAPQAQCNPAEPVVPAIGRVIKIIPSPIMNIQSSKVSAPPGWLVTAAVAMLIPITALGVVNYWILPSQRPAAAAPVQTAAAAAPVKPVAAAPATVPEPAAAAPVAAGLQKQLEFTGLRLQQTTVKCIVVNHGKTGVPATHLLVTLRTSRGSESPVGTFKVQLSPLAAGDSREIAEPINFVPPMRSNVDWSDLKAEVQVIK